MVASYYMVKRGDRKETHLCYFTGIVEFHEKDYFDRECNGTLMEIVKDKGTNNLVPRYRDSSEGIVYWDAKDIEYPRSDFIRNSRKQSKEILKNQQR
jgi:hypothetical protein